MRQVRYPRPARRAIAGFSLLEVLAVLVVLGLILAGLNNGLSFGQRALHAEARAASIPDGFAPVDATLRGLVAHAWPGGQGAGGARFTGTARSVSFRTRMPDAMAETGRANGQGVALRTNDADIVLSVDAAHRLVLSWRPWYKNWIVPKPPPSLTVLLDGVERVEFRYWDPELHLPAGQWVTAWDGARAPRLIRIRLVFAEGTGPNWPDIVAATARDPWEY